MEGSKAFDLLLFLTEQARKHDEDVDSIRLQLQTHSVQLTSIHELLLSMRPLKSDPPLHEWSSPPPPLLPLTETLPPPLHPLYQQQDPPSLTTAPSLPILSNLPSLKKSPSSIPLSKDGPLDLKELRRSLQGAGQQAFGSQSNPLFPPADQPPPPPHQETSASKQSLPAVDQELEGEARFSEKTALLVDHKNQPQDRHPQGNGNGNSETLGAYSDGDVAMKVSSELQSRVQQNDPHGFMGFLYLVKEVLWGGLLLPHQKNIWDVFICVLLLWVAFGTPMVICFGLKADLLQGHPLGWIEFWVNLFFVIDMYLNFRTAYIDKMGNLVTNKRMIAHNYLKRWFLIDLISVIPLHLFGGPSWTEFTTLFKLFRVIRIAKIFRMLRAYSSLKGGSSEAKRSFIPRLIEWLDMKMDKSLIGISLAIFTVIVVFHMSACLFFYTAFLQNLSPQTWFGYYMGPNAQDASLFIKYLNSIYWAATTMTTVGYGDVVPKLPGEKIVAIPLMIIGVNLLGYITSSIANIISVRNASQQIVDTKKNMIRAFLKDRGIPNHLANRINRFFHYVSMKEIRPDEKQIVQELPPKLRSRVLYHMYRDVIEKVPSFRDQHPDLLAMVVSNLRPEYYMSGDVIICQGDPGEGMYIIGDGDIEARTYEVHDENDASLLLAASTDQDLLGWPFELRGKLTPPGFWGHVTALEGLPSPVTLIASTFCELFLLPTDDLEEVLERFPEVKEVLLPPPISEAIKAHAHLLSPSNTRPSSLQRDQVKNDQQALTGREIESFIIRVDYPSLVSTSQQINTSEGGGLDKASCDNVAPPSRARSVASISIGRPKQGGGQGGMAYESIHEGEVAGGKSRAGPQEASFSVRFAPDPSDNPSIPSIDPSTPKSNYAGDSRTGRNMSMSFALKRNSVRQKSGLGGPEGLPPLSTTSFPASSYWAQIPDPYEGAIEREASQSGNPDLARSSVQTSDRLAQPSLARLSRKSFGSNSSYALGGPPRGQSATMSSSYGRSSLAAAHTSFLLRSSLVPSSHAGGYKSVRSSVRQSQRIREEGDGAQSSSSIEMATHDPQAPPPPTGQDPSFSLDQHQESSRRSTAPSALGSQSEGSGSKQSPRFATHASKRRAELLKTPISSDEEDEGKI